MGVLKYLLPLAFLGFTLAEPRWYSSSDGRNYLIDADQKYNWLSAQQNCLRKNLRLVEIKSETKNEALVELLQTVFGRSVDLWLGANDELNAARPFFWSSSGERMDFSNWSEGSPDTTFSKENCVQISSKSPNFEWSSLPCTEQIGFICEEKTAYETRSKSIEENGQQALGITRDFIDQITTMEKLYAVTKAALAKVDELARYNTKLGFEYQLLRSTVKVSQEMAQKLDKEIKEASKQMNKKMLNNVNELENDNRI